jgi:hypothetical protein
MILAPDTMSGIVHFGLVYLAFIVSRFLPVDFTNRTVYLTSIGIHHIMEAACVILGYLYRSSALVRTGMYLEISCNLYDIFCVQLLDHLYIGKIWLGFYTVQVYRLHLLPSFIYFYTVQLLTTSFSCMWAVLVDDMYLKCIFVLQTVVCTYFMMLYARDLIDLLSPSDMPRTVTRSVKWHTLPTWCLCSNSIACLIFITHQVCLIMFA